MDVNEFREFGKAMVDYIADYWDNIDDRDSLPAVEPGYITKLVPSEAPIKGENWKDILKDVDRVIMPGLTHWQAPNFFAYFPAGFSFPSVVGELLNAGIGTICFNWMASPVGTELEIIMMNWLGQLLGLPDYFLNRNGSQGGGVIQGSSSESILLALLAAKEKTIQLINSNSQTALISSSIMENLVAYTSDQANCCIDKVSSICSVRMVHLKSKNYQLTGETLRKAIRNDREKGLIPCVVVATIGTTGTCACDNLEELGQVCQDEKVWLHVDAAYAGSAMVCPEYRYLMKGIDLCDSLNISPHKWMLVNFDCTGMWLKDRRYLLSALGMQRIYLDDQNDGYGNDRHNWQISIGRKFRSLKLWFVLRSYGVEGIQKYIRQHISLARYFEKLVEKDSRFEVCSSSFALVCFRLKGDNCHSQLLLNNVNADKKYYLTPYTMEGKFVIRFAICSILSSEKHVRDAWNTILSYTDILKDIKRTDLRDIDATNENNCVCTSIH